MNIEDFARKFPSMLLKMKQIARFPLKEVKDLMDDPLLTDNERLYFRLDYIHRTQGGDTPLEIILKKMEDAHKSTCLKFYIKDPEVLVDNYAP
jgi:hypothetical protein